MSRLSLILAATLAFAGAQPALAQQKFENLDRIDSLVAMTVGANMGEPGGPLAPVDRRLRLAACPTTPSVDGPTFGAAIVKCDALGWRIRVPLVAGGAAGMTGPVARYAPAARAVPKEAAVKRGDPVQLNAGNAAFSVSRMMIADEDGAVGETIRVREDKKSAPILAQVVEMGVVRVPGFNEF
ncbi:flagella basal body P-ring formation protein FlgA [Sphingobium sp. AP49]|uniref:flagella basal body P-ring formation protein FlgA n=1 Tax=Sphingobium sp. AP49 TaxID=1144307 RepID=UPI00026EE5BB|nr:flagella basal body P-ring formation protein FlgA [Sphingobium sp. AP49]WHO38285.1 flagella basal body P-ring formation protein FlgA [Sphingobium sp. AP49]